MLICKCYVNVMKLLDLLRQYFSESLGVNVKIEPLREPADLPIFLRDKYFYYKTELLKNNYIFFSPRDKITPAIINKDMQQLQAKFGLSVIYVNESLSSHDRKRLIEYRIPFVIPGNQMYLPHLGIDLREYFIQKKVEVKYISPATQAVLLYFIIGKEIKEKTPMELAKKLHYSPMTLTRAFDELEALGIGKMIYKGKERFLVLQEHGRNLWSKFHHLMRSPIKKQFLVKIDTKNEKKIKEYGVLSGMSALAELSTLHEPKYPSYAVSQESWNRIKKTELIKVPLITDDANMELEIWIYDPKLFASDNLVDPFSLFLSLKNSQDERVEQALENLMRQIKW